MATGTLKEESNALTLEKKNFIHGITVLVALLMKSSLL